MFITDDLKQQVEKLKLELKQAHERISQLESQVKNEGEIDKILNSDFSESEEKSMSFYGVPTKDAKSPLQRNKTHLLNSKKKRKLEFSDPTDKLEQGLKYYK